MADKMLRMAGRGDDGKAKALKTDNEGNLGVQLTGSSIADDSPLPTKSPAIKEEKIGDSVTITASGTIEVASLDMLDASSYYVFVVPDSEHEWTMTGQRRTTSLEPLDPMVTDREQVSPQALKGTTLTKEFKVIAGNLRVFLRNDDTVDHTYNVWLYKRITQPEKEEKEKDQRGLAANKPSADSVEEGTTYWSVDTDPNAEYVEVSNGTNWVVMA